MKDEELEKLSLDSFDEDEFMLNTKDEYIKEEDILDDTFIIDTPIEKDLSEDIEIMEEVPKVVEKKEIKEEKKKKSKERKSRVDRKKSKGFKMPKDTKGKVIYILEAIFCLCSFAFIIGCFIHYGSRLIKYYRIYNPKTETGEVIELIGASLTKDIEYKTEGEGVYRINGASVYKGVNVNNYIYFANQLWRIISINPDGSLDIITDNYINALSYSDSAVPFKESDINKYLNDKFLSAIDKSYLSPTSFCIDEVDDVTKVTCNNLSSEDYVRLIGITEFINSKIGNETYLSSEEGYWMYNSSTKGAWHTNGTNVSLDKATEPYLVRPVVKIKNSLQLLGGKGTLEDPYRIQKENKNLEVGKYIKLGEDTWVIYEINDESMNLALNGTLKSVYKFSNKSSKFDTTSTGSLGLYLNTTYLQNLSYKDIINENTWYIGSYNSKYENVTKTTVKAKVGINNVADLKIGSNDDMFYLSTPVDDNNVYFYNEGLIKSKVTLSRNIKPTININKLSIESGKGTLEDPYILEVK